MIVNVIDGFLALIASTGDPFIVKGSAILYVRETSDGTLIGLISGTSHRVQQDGPSVLSAISESYKQAGRR